MNAQGSAANPNGGIEWTHIFGPRTGYTANPVRGCEKGCRWKMPDGKIARCYAEDVHERFHKTPFSTVTFHPEVLDKVREHAQPAGIFFDSMSDLLGNKVTRDQINLVIDCMQSCPQHIFFVLTKSPFRLIQFRWPKNCMVGVSAPPTWMHGKKIDEHAQRTMYRKSLKFLADCDATHRFTSIEPLSFDVAEIIREHRRSEKERAVAWAIIGAASDGTRLYQPLRHDLINCFLALRGVPVFLKGNMDRSYVESCGLPYDRQFPVIKRSGSGQTALAL